MRVLVRNHNTSKFLADGKHWVRSRDTALDFGTSVLALNTATRMELSGVEIVLDFGNAQSDVVLKVPDKGPGKRQVV